MTKRVIFSEFAARDRKRVRIDLGGHSRTKQSMKDETDVNQIVARFRATGLVSHLAKGQPHYMDVSAIGDYRQALQEVRKVGQFFDGLPADIRADYGNDPAEFLDFVNAATPEELREAGLVPSGVVGSEPARGADGRFVSEKLDAAEGVGEEKKGGVSGSGGDVSGAPDSDGDV